MLLDNPFKDEWHNLFYRDPRQTDPDLFRFARWLRQNKEMEIHLFHGTSTEVPVMERGLLPTSSRRRRSLQSGSGYVYLSVFPGMAETFGKMGAPTRPTVVYAVKVKIKELRADTDQLRNKRMWSDDKQWLEDTLCHSLVFGYGARVKGKIEPYKITVHKTDT